MDMRMGWLAAVATVCVIVIASLCRAPWQLADAITHIGGQDGSVQIDRLAGWVAGCGLLMTAAWLLAGLTAAVLARRPGRLGARMGRVAPVLLPAALQRLIAGSAGLGVLLAPVAAGAAQWHDAPVARAASAQPSPPVWPSDTSSAAPQGTRNPAPPPTRHPHVTPPAPRTSPATPRVRPHDPGERVYTVRGGDSLWLIAQRRLDSGSGPAAAQPADVARLWPQLYARNRAAVGDDPSLIRPGLRLVLPSPSTNEHTP